MKVLENLKKRDIVLNDLTIQKIHFVSAKTGFGMKHLFSQIKEKSKELKAEGI